MDTQELSKENKNIKWGFIGTLLWGLLIAVLYIVIQTVVSLAYAKAVLGDVSADMMNKIGVDGTALSLATFSTMIACGLAIVGVIKIKKDSHVKDYLAIRKVGLSNIKYWLFIVIILIIVTDSLTFLLGKPIVVEFMTTVYRSTERPWILFLALVIAAPVFEELFFRGFLLSGFSSTFLGPVGSVLITSLAWSAIHMQYDLYGIFTIFIAGVVLGVARLKTNSTLTTIMMHSIMNFVASIETVIYVAQKA